MDPAAPALSSGGSGYPDQWRARPTTQLEGSIVVPYGPGFTTSLGVGSTFGSKFSAESKMALKGYDKW